MTKLPRVYLSPPHLSGEEYTYIKEALDSNWVAPIGPHLNQFEQQFAEYVGTKYAAGVSSGTAALHLALHCLEIEPGDEVICSDFTFIASANPIIYERAVPVFIDSEPTSWNLDPNLLEEELKESAVKGKLPQAIIAVDILGQSADMDTILQIANRFEVPVIEDAAEALGARYKDRSAGNNGVPAIFSFNGNKIITTSSGGMFCSDDEQLVQRVRYLSTQANDPGPFYRHAVAGFNYRMSNILAAAGIAQLEVLPQRVTRRREIRAIYREEFSAVDGIQLMPEAPWGESNAWLTTVLVDRMRFGSTPEAIRLRLEDENIESRRVWIPLHQQPAYASYRSRGGAFAESLFENALSLPSGTAMSDDLVRRIASIVIGSSDGRMVSS